MSSAYQPEPGRSDRPTVNARTLWAGGAAAALVAALVALVGILVFRGVFDVNVLAPEGDGVWGDVSTVWLMVAAAVAALLATALAHVFLLTTPRPLAFFSWVIGLITVAAALAPFATSAEMDSKVATAVINGVVGITILSLVSGVARMAIRRGPPTRPV